MKNYVGTKFISAKEMTRGEYNNYRGVSIPKKDECYYDDGYLVKYSDGYESWSPKKQFEDAYREWLNDPPKMVHRSTILKSMFPNAYTEFERMVQSI